VTFGVYYFYWLFKIARVMGYIKGDPKLLWKLLLLLIPFYNLYWYSRFFGGIEDEARAYEGVVPPLTLLAFVGGLIGVLSRLPDTWWWLATLSFVPYAVVQAHFARLQTLKWPTSIVPYRYRWGDWVIIGLGGIWVVLTVAGSLMPSASGAPSNGWGLLLTLSGALVAVGIFFTLDARDRRLRSAHAD
jgi:hypothetical protein